MRKPRLLGPIAALALASATLPAAQKSLVLAPQPGTERDKRIERRDELALEELEVSLDGEDVGSSFDALDYLVATELSMQVRDTYSEVSGNELHALVRAYGPLSLKTTHSLVSPSAPAGQVTELEGTTPLDGRTVTFVRGADGFEARFETPPGSPAPGSAPDPGLARGLDFDLDFTGFLPRVPVEVGDRWKVDPAGLSTLFSPGGALGFQARGASNAPTASLAPLPESLGRPEGEVEARFSEVDDSSGQRVARVALRLTLTWTRDLDDSGSSLTPSFPPPVSVELETARTTRTFTGTGTLDWNLDARVLERLRIEGETAVSVDQQGRLRTGTLAQSWSQRITLRGPRTLTVHSGPR